MKKIVSKNKIKLKKMSTKSRSAFGGNKKIPTVFALMIIIIVAFVFGGWVRYLNRQMKSDLAGNFSREILKKNTTGESSGLTENQTVSNAIAYVNDEIGFRMALPKDGRRYAVKEISPKGMDRAVLFGLPLMDSEVKKVKKEDYSELFRIELVPLVDLNKKSCADKSRQFPFCNSDDRELGRNSQFVFVYTRYDKLDAVEKSKVKLIPADFDASVFAQADEISKSFRLVLSQDEGVNKNI